MSPTSGTAIAAPPNTAGADATRKSGDTNMSPVAWAPRWVSEMTPSTRPSRWSGTSSCAAELRRTTDVLCPVAAKNAPATASGSDPASATRP